MPCRCNERRQAVVRTVQAIRTGDRADVGAELKFIAKSTIEDVGSQMRQRILAARQLLQGRAR